jgi:hypothetical protein
MEVLMNMLHVIYKLATNENKGCVFTNEMVREISKKIGRT